jgi:hypothetical protein
MVDFAITAVGTYVLLRWVAPAATNTLEQMTPSRIVRKPTARERKPDCLAEVLLDFLALDHAALPREELQDWLVTVAMCLRTILEHDCRAGAKSLGAAQWLEVITNRLASAFPNFPGGRPRIAQIIEAMVWKGTSERFHPPHTDRHES